MKIKKYRYLIWGMIAVALSIYTVYAWYMVNGINIYFVTYEQGRLLVYTYIPAGVIAVLFWVVFVKSVKKARKDKKKSVPAQPIADEPTDTKMAMKEQTIEKTMDRVCYNCGEKLDKDAKFCTKCGSKAE